VRISRLSSYISEIRSTRDRSQLIKKSKKYVKHYSNINRAIKTYERNLRAQFTIVMRTKQLRNKDVLVDA